MIERQNDYFVPCCDYCGKRLAPETEKQAAIDKMKLAGWNSPKLGEHINNYCAECARYLGVERKPAPRRPYQNNHGSRSKKWEN